MDWLTRNPSVEDQVEAIADIVGVQAVRVLTEHGRTVAQQELAADHLICSILASIARALDELKEQLDKVPDRVISLLTKRSGGSMLNEATVRIVVRSSWRAINSLPIFRQVDTLLRATRIAAVLKCPALGQHAEVIRFCLWPLAEELVSAVTLQKLKEFLPQKLP